MVDAVAVLEMAKCHVGSAVIRMKEGKGNGKTIMEWFLMEIIQ